MNGQFQENSCKSLNISFAKIPRMRCALKALLYYCCPGDLSADLHEDRAKVLILVQNKRRVPKKLPKLAAILI